MLKVLLLLEVLRWIVWKKALFEAEVWLHKQASVEMAVVSRGWILTVAWPFAWWSRQSEGSWEDSRSARETMSCLPD